MVLGKMYQLREYGTDMEQKFKGLEPAAWHAAAAAGNVWLKKRE